MSEKVLREARDAKEKADETSSDLYEIKSEISPIVEAATEQDEEIKSPDIKSIEISENESAILNALRHEKFTLRSRTGIMEDTGLDTKEVTDILAALTERGLIGQSLRKKGIRWWIKPKGIIAIKKPNNANSL